MRHFATATAIAALFVAMPAMAQEQGAEQQPQQQQAQEGQQGEQGQQQVAEADRQFAEDAYVGNRLEIRLGEIALRQAESQEVKDFGQRMVKEHGAANTTLNPIIAKLGIEAPTDLPQDARDTADRFQDMEGQEFDQAYAQKMVEEHQKAVDLYKKQADDGENQELQAYAEDTLSTLEAHLQQAQDLNQKAGTMAQSGASGDQSRQQAETEQPDQEGQQQAEADQSTRQDQEGQQQADAGQQMQTDQDGQQAEMTDQAGEEMEQAGQDMEQAGEDAMQSAEQAGEDTMQTAEQAGDETMPSGEQAMEGGEQTARLPNLEGVVGQSVYGQNDEQIGEVSEVLMDSEGNAERLVIDRGGFLGIGEQHIAVEVSKLNIIEDGILLDMSDEQLAEMPEYEETE